MRELARELIKKHEGYRDRPYHCTEGRLTIGYGRNLDDRGITESEAEVMLDNDIDECLRQLANGLSFWEKLNETRQAVLLDMCFNMGYQGLCGFRNMLAALEKEDWEEASSQMLDSRWATQVYGRAEELADLMRRG